MMRIKQFFLFLAVLLTARISLSFDVSGMQDNTWYKIDTKWEYLPGSGEYQHRGWCTLRYDSTDKTVLFIEGNNDPSRGGYCIYANAFYEFNIVTDTVRMRGISNWWCKSAGGLYPLEGMPETPRPRHTSSQFAYVSSEDAVYIADGASGVGRHPKDFWGFSFREGKLTELEPAPGSTTSNPAVLMGGCLIYKDSTKELFYFKHDSLHVYDLDDKSWRTVTTLGKRNKGGHGCYDSQRDRVVFYGNMWTSGGTGSKDLQFFDVKTNTFSTVPVSGVWPPAKSYAGIEYNTKHDVYMLHGGKRQNDTWIYDPKTESWAELSTDTSPPNAGVGIMVTYDTDRNLLVRFDNSTKGKSMWVLRYEPAAANESGLSGSGE